MKNILIVGQATHGEQGSPWRAGTSAKRLAEWLGMTKRELAEKCSRTNVGDYAGQGVKGDKCRVNLKKVERALRMAKKASLVILVGRVAQRAMFKNHPLTVVWREGKYCGVPHPSGVNLQLNDVGSDRVKKWMGEQLRRRGDAGE